MKTTTIRNEPAVTRAQATANAYLAELAASDKARTTPVKADKLWVVMFVYSVLALGLLWGLCWVLPAAFGVFVANVLLLAAMAIVGIITAIIGLGPVVALLAVILYFVIRIANRK